MEQIFKKFTLKELLKQDQKIVVYRAIRIQDQRPVILKVLQGEHPDLSEVARLEREYELLKTLSIPMIPKTLGLVKEQNRVALILEDTGEPTLEQVLQGKPMPIKSFLLAAIQLSKILGELHQLGLIHKDIKPSNIIVDPETGQTQLIDFNLVSQLPHEIHASVNLEALEGTLAYVSPEQTGRMGRPLDYRTDFYSLGVTFYEMVTGQLPFQATDAIGLVHAHIARVPTPPHQVNPQIPLAISNIIMKLLEKTAEARYQSAYGLAADLQKLLGST